MQIVNFQCGKCGKLMGVSAEHLGAQVHCPHCQEIVETPAPPAATDPYAEVRVHVPDVQEQESIFTAPDDGQGEDLFGGPSKPLVELPPESAPRHAAPERIRVEQRSGTASRAAALSESTAAFEPPKTEQSAPEADDSHLATTAPAPRSSRSSMLGPMLLVLLIPYSLLATVYIIWSMLNRVDPLERLPDSGKEGSPRRINPDKPLPPKLKTSLQQLIRVGELEITPLKVELNRDGDLVLLLKMTNVSADQAFSPVHDSYLRYSETSRKSPRPYAYLDIGSQGKLYGGYLRYLKAPNAKDEERDGLIGPGQAIYVQVTTPDKYRDGLVKAALKSQGPMVWRVHFRRGLVAVQNRSVSATAVIGVEFPTAAIEKARG